MTGSNVISNFYLMFSWLLTYTNYVLLPFISDSDCMYCRAYSAVSTCAALRVALRGVASVASLVATSCRVVALRVAARCWLRVALRCVGHHVFYW